MARQYLLIVTDDQMSYDNSATLEKLPIKYSAASKMGVYGNDHCWFLHKRLS